MSVMVTCPTCQVMLRVPPGAETIRCPQCKTVLALQPAAEPTAPPPSPARPAIPLPFERPPAVPPVAAPPAAVPPPRRRKATRGRVVEEYEDEPREEVGRPRREASDEEKLEAKLEKVGAEARPARVGVRLLAYGAIAGCSTPLFVALFYFTTVFLHSGDNPFVFVPFVTVAAHWLLTLAGFGFCCAGPKGMRHMALGGVIIMLVQAVAMLALVQLTARAIGMATVGFGGINTEAGLLGSLLLSNLFNNLSGLTNLPAIVLLSQHLFGPAVFVVVLFAGAVEFAKLSMIGILANHYAVEGKAPELGFQSIRFVYRIIWVVIVGFVGQVISIGVSYLGFGFVFFSLPGLMMTLAYFLWTAFAWLAEFQVLLAVVEVITPERFIDKRRDLDTYY